MIVDPDILIVIGAVVSIFAFSSCVAGWVSRSWPWAAIISLAIGVGLLGFVHLQLPEGLTPLAIPDAFINVAAMILN